MRGIVLAYCLLAMYATSAELPRGYRIELPRDGGSHPEFTTEWWYVTGWLQDNAGVQRGFQITFFRSRNSSADANPSKFALQQLLFAHSAVSDPASSKLLLAERTARAGFGLAEAASDKLSVSIRDWRLHDEGDRIAASVGDDRFALALSLTPSQPMLLHGEEGYSRKGPEGSASYYYSLPHLQVSGTMTLNNKQLPVKGTAWFDHEWSNTYVDASSNGWDWIGINLLDGGALMAFRMRDKQGAQRWTSATWRSKDATKILTNDDIEWTELAHWRSPRTGHRYPVAWRVRIGKREIVLRPLMDDQESDARRSVGILYWEGAVEAFDAAGSLLGRGYLELTGYDVPVKL